MNHWAKYIFLLLVCGLSFIQAPARAHTGSPARSAVQISENCPPKVNSEQDCCPEQLCRPSRHDPGGDNCCRHNNIPAFGLPVSLMLPVHHALLVTEKTVIAYIPDYLSPGYPFIWLPPKID